MQITIPELSLIVLIGTSGAGKSTFARRHFRPTEIVSSDYCRGVVDDDENSLDATADAFDLLHYIVRKRLQRGRLTVVDATNVQPEARKKLIELAREHYVQATAIILDIPIDIAQARNDQRPERDFGPHVIRNQYRQLRRSFRGLKREGFRYIHVLKSPEEVEAVSVAREKLWNDKKELTGPFDIIGDVHGCFTELRELLDQLGYRITQHRDRDRNYGYTVLPPEGRTAVFLGDLADRGPASNEVFRLVMSMVENGAALCVCGNHDAKLLNHLKGKSVNLKHGLVATLEQLKNEPPAFLEDLRSFLNGLISHYVLDGGRLVVAHAGLREEMQGRASGVVRSFCLYGETTGEIDEFGLPVRYDWAREYNGQAMVVYGHTPVPEPEWLNRTIDIDTGCVFGGKLTAFRYPERELVSIPARKMYYEPAKPLQPAPEDSRTAQQAHDDLLHIEDVQGKRIIHTRLRHNLTIREENAIAALEVMSRFAVDPRWLIYLPPTMSPPEVSSLEDYLEHPAEVFDYFLERDVTKVICEEKHMGSRAVVVLAKDPESVLKRFGIQTEDTGIIYTRTGRAFFPDKKNEQQLLFRLRDALTAAGFWDRFQTGWVALDCEIMPWSDKAQLLLENQYAAGGAAGRMTLPLAGELLEQAAKRGNGRPQELLANIQERIELNRRFTEAYRPYCWPVNQLEDYKIAPFHILATEGQVHVDKDHAWHMKEIHAFCAQDPAILLATEFRAVDLNDDQRVAEIIRWWEQHTGAGGEGMVVKPYDFVARNAGRLVQPAIKCRGREYLRIIYGADYTMSDNLLRLKKRGISRKRSLAIREFALGIEALERFVRRDPLRKVHECVFGVLALESEPVDPAL
jgi:protein phosphatase